MKPSFFSLFFVLILCVSFNVQAQNLIIVSTGQTGISGTNWSISGNTLNVAASGTASVHPSVISNHLNNVGDLTVVLPAQSGVRRQCSIDGAITYTGTATRTLTFIIANDIFITTPNNSISATNGALNVILRAATSLSPDDGRISFRNNTINTKGGHLWMGGGSGTSTWNNLTVGNSVARTWQDDIPGLWIQNATLNTNGGNLYLAGLSHNTGDDIGLNHGVLIDNSSIASASGNIEIRGDLRGKFTNGYGIAIFSSTGPNAITATTGSINIRGDGFDQATNGNGWRHGLVIANNLASNPLIISTTSGNIQLEGNANFAATINDKEGLILGGSGLGIVSRTGNIVIKGSNTLENSGQYSNSIRIASSDVANAIRIGFDGTNTYSGNITIEGNSIYQRNQNAGSGSIAIQSTGNLTIQPTGNAFTYMRAGDAGTLTFDNDWNFGNNLGGFVYGKTTNTSNLTYGNSLTTAGPVTFYTGNTQLGVGVNIYTTGANGNITFLATNGFSTAATIGATTRGKIMTKGGNININADADNNNIGQLNIDWLTIDGSTGNMLLEGATYVWETNMQVVLPEFYGTGTLTIRPVTSANHPFNLNWIGLFRTAGQSFSALNLGRDGGTSDITFSGCTVCDVSAINRTGNTVEIAGPINLYGGNITINENLRSTLSGADILFKAAKHIIVGENDAVRTNNGDITFWSNSDGIANATDGDFIGIYSGVSVNSANGLTNQTAGGGTITMAGGTTTQTLASGTVVPTGYALSTRITNWVDVLPPGGVNFGEKRSAVGGTNTVNIHSGGGDIVIKGQSNSSSAGVQWFSGPAGATQMINSGNGTVTIDGLSTSSTAHGIEFMSYAAVVYPTVISSNTTSAAIRIKGETSSTNNRAGYQGTVILEANGTGGGIEINGKVASLSNYGAIEAGSLNAYALSGPLTFISEGGLGLRAGGLWGKGTLASSSSNITLRSDRIALFTTSIESTGTLTVEPLGTSFASAITFPITNLTVGNTVSGLSIGKSSNTANITFGGATTIAGPITAYGGNIFTQQNLTSTLSGASILLQATGYIDLTASRTLQTNNGDITIKANSSGTAVVLPNSTTGAITLNSGSSILSNGGNITLGGNFDGTKGTGLYAASARVGGSPGILISGATLTAAGGNINIYGRCSTSYDDGIRLQANISTSGTGSIGIYGDAFGGLTTGTPDIWFGGITFITNSSTVETENGNINVEGILTNTQSNGAYALNFYRSAYTSGTNTRDIQIISKTGDIQITGDRGTTSAGGMGHSSWGDIYFGSPLSGSWTTTGDVKFSYSSFVGAGAKGFKVKTTGAVIYEPTAASFVNAQTIPHNANYIVAENASSLTIGKSTNTANITFGGATTIAGPITVYGGEIAINNNLSSTLSGADITLKASNKITVNSGASSSVYRSIQTNNGNILLWSNAAGGTSGGIIFGDWTTLNSANGSTTQTTGGGKVWLAGGSTTNSDGLPTGPAVGTTNNLSGVCFGTLSSGTTTTSLYSGGGDVFIHGAADNSNGLGVSWNRTGICRAGSGKITIIGESKTQTGSHGIELGAYAGSMDMRASGGDANTPAISLKGSSEKIGFSGIQTNGGAIQASSLGGINIEGNTPSGNTTGSVLNIGMDLLSANGNISVVANGPRGLRYLGTLGQKTGTDVASSISNVRLAGNVITVNSNINVNTSGTLVVEPTSDRFTDALSWPITNLTLANTISGLTLGKSTNTANITFGGATTIAGPVNVFGGTISINANLTTTNPDTGNVGLNGATISGTGNIALAAGRTATFSVTGISTYNGIISGSGSGLTKSGTGMLILTNDHTYSGATTVMVGDLQVGTGGSVSQASSGTISSTSGVTVSNGSKLILTPNENIIFAAPISGAGGVEIKGASGAFYNSFLTGTAATIATNSTVLEVLTRITGGMQQGAAITGSQVAGTYHKIYNAASNTATFQFQQFDGTFTKCVFAQLTQSGTNVQIRANTNIYNGASYRNNNTLGENMSTGSIEMGLATNATATGYGISNVYMSGKVNFTGNLTYTGNTILSNTVTSVTSPNTYTYTSKGTQEITDASSSFPAASTVVNNGLVILNRSTPLTIASDMQGTEDVLQVGAAITLTGTNTHSGNTTIDINKSLIIGNGSTTGSISGNIINFGALTFNRSDNSTYSGIISGSGTLTKLGEGLHTLTGLNTYTGATTISAGKLILERDVPVTSSSGFNGTGHLVIQPSSASFTNLLTYPIAAFTVANTIGGLALGKPGNDANITISGATSIAGPIEVYGGTITANANLTSAATIGSGISLIGRRIIQNVGIAVTTSGANIDYLASGFSTTSGIDKAITIGVESGVRASINAGGGNVSLTGSFGTTSIAGEADFGIWLFSTDVITSGTGSITLTGDATNTLSTLLGYGMSMGNATLKTTSGAITLNGTGGKASANSRGIVADGFSNKIVSVSGAITLNEIKPIGLTGTFRGFFMRPATSVNTFIGADGNEVPTSSSSVTIKADRASFDVNATFRNNINTSGIIVLESVANSFETAPLLTGLTISGNPSNVRIGKSTNTANITMESAVTAAGPITVFGGTITVNENLNTTGAGVNGDVLLKANSNISLAASKSITTTGGDVIFWSDQDANSDGTISLLSAASIQTSGGRIVLAGGLDNGSNLGTNSDGIPDGYARGVGVSGISTSGSFTINSGAGPITMKGSSDNRDGILLSANSSSTGSIISSSGTIDLLGFVENGTIVNGQSGGFIQAGIRTSGGGTINIESNTGTVKLEGNGPRYGLAFGVFIQNGSVYFDSDGATQTIIKTANTSSNAISINGNGQHAASFRGSATKIHSTAALGGIILNATSPSWSTTVYNPLEILAVSGPINWQNSTSTDGVGIFNLGSIAFGSKSGVAGLTSSSSNININLERLTSGASPFAIATSGQVNILGVNGTASFGQEFNTSIFGLNANSQTMSGFTFGAVANSQNLTFGQSITVAGPITAYGGTITLNANLTTTNNGTVSLFTNSPLAGLSTARTLTAAGAFKYIPRTTTFSADVTYPITGLTATSTGLTIGNATNDKNITINADVSGGAGIELYGNNVNINSNLTTTGLSTVMHLKGNTTIAAGKTITSGGNFTHDGNLTFKSDVDGTAAFGQLGGGFNKINGITTVERFIPAKRGWRLLTTPLKGTTNTTVTNNWQGVNGEGLLLFSPATYQSQTMIGYTTGGGMPNIWNYNNGWQSIPNITAENLFNSVGNNGFLVFATGPQASTNIATGSTITTLKPKGDLITGSVSHALTANQYKLIGNPYASPLNTVAMTQANVGSKVWVIDPSLGTVGGYYAYDGSNWAPAPPAASDAYIQSGQGFFARTATNSNFIISESHKVTGNSNTWFSKTANNLADKIRVLLYKQNNTDWQLADGILAVNSPSGNNEVDHTDTGKMSNFNENLMFTNGSSNLSIEYRGLPNASTTQTMRLTGTTVHPYQLRVKVETYTNNNLQPYIQDTQTGTVTPVPIDGTEVVLPFTGVVASSVNPDNRFRIVYQATLSTNDFNVLSVGVYPNPVNDGVFTILLKENTTMPSYTLTNLLGQQVQEGKLIYPSNIVKLKSLQTGIYILRIEQEGKTFSTKLIIK